MLVTVFEFGDFKLDSDRFELYRSGRIVKLERKPMELRILLASRNGHLVTRAEIAERLWAREVFVGTEHGISTAIRKVRQALREDPEQPRFLLTVTGKGYPFCRREQRQGLSHNTASRRYDDAINEFRVHAEIQPRDIAVQFRCLRRIGSKA